MNCNKFDKNSVVIGIEEGSDRKKNHRMFKKIK